MNNNKVQTKVVRHIFEILTREMGFIRSGKIQDKDYNSRIALTTFSKGLKN